MKRARLLYTVIILAILISACGNKKNKGPVIIEAQDNGRDTTKSELVKGDSAGKAEDDMNSEEKEEQEASKNEVADGWHADGNREIIILGEWECSDGSKWTLDNGYNLKYSDGSQNLIGSYNFNFSSAQITFEFWNIEKVETVEDFDSDNNVIGTHEYKAYITGDKKYSVVSYEHNTDYTTGTLKLTDSDGKELTATLKKPIKVNLKAKKASENKREFEKKQKEAEEKELAAREGLSVKEYRENKKAEEELRKQAKQAGMTLKEYKKSIGISDEDHHDDEGEHIDEQNTQ